MGETFDERPFARTLAVFWLVMEVRGVLGVREPLTALEGVPLVWGVTGGTVMLAVVSDPCRLRVGAAEVVRATGECPIEVPRATPWGVGVEMDADLRFPRVEIVLSGVLVLSGGIEGLFLEWGVIGKGEVLYRGVAGAVLGAELGAVLGAEAFA